MKAVKVETDGSIKLPKEMLRLFPTSSELAVWTEGDMGQKTGTGWFSGLTGGVGDERWPDV
jgi:hypothetical protein